MKNKTIILISMLISLTAAAQVRTGGTGGVPEPDTLGHAGEKIMLLGKYLQEADQACSPNKRLIKDIDLMQAYLKLSLFKKTEAQGDDCEEADKYLSCLSNGVRLKAKVEAVRRNKHSLPWIQIHYSINAMEAEKILKFFEELEKK